MTIDQNTKISKVIAENPKAIDAIVSINKHFKKLQNPILRKVLAPRVTVKDAAGIGGVSVNVFLQKLADIGMSVQIPPSNKSEPIETNELPFELIQDKIVPLDVRPTIERGADPFSDIMAKIKDLQPDQILKVINVFEPIPLMNVLGNKGFASFTEKVNNNEFHTFFKKTGSEKKPDTYEIGLPILDNFDSKMLDFGSNLMEIDVRDLEMPEPMTKILETLSILPENHVLFVHHKKVPQFLLPELKSRHFHWLTKDIEEGYVQLLIWKSID